jgi:hypothetical protein
VVSVVALVEAQVVVAAEVELDPEQALVVAVAEPPTPLQRRAQSLVTVGSLVALRRP